MNHAHHTTRALGHLLLLGLWSLTGSCATGRAPPAPTAMAEFRDEKPFTFGMGLLGCTIPQSTEACKTASSFESGEPEVLVTVKPFALDVHEVTNEQYQYCVEMGRCSEPAGYNGPPGIVDQYFYNERYNDYPVVLLRWNQAREYCAFVGKRLPTEFEWERAAGGPSPTKEEKRVYPWSAKLGYEPPLTKCDKDANIAACNSGTSSTRPVRASADDVVSESGQQIYDLAGNVAEFTASDLLRREKFVACDTTQPYTCGDCVQCLETSTLAACKTKCLPCQCGTGSTATAKPNCYAPCDTPICPKRPPGHTPVDGSYTGKNIAQGRIVRGGSYFAKGAECAGRSDNRQQSLKPDDDPQTWIGFRCAKTL
jgi:formylglycine-generating enzyme required for sulfatase activity